MTEKIIPITLQPQPNSSSVLAVIHQSNKKISVVELDKEDIASLREEIINYYRRMGHLEPEYKPNAFKGEKPVKKPVKEEKKVTISASLYSDFQHLYNENKNLKADLARSHHEIDRLNKLIEDSKKDAD